MPTYTNYAIASNDGQLNGTTPVTVVASPSSGQVITVRNITIQQADTASVTLTVRYVNGGNTRVIWSGTLSPGDTWVAGEEDFFVLDATNKSITALLGGSAATTNPYFVACYSVQS